MRADEGERDLDTEFTDALAGLKADGCSLLVVGTVPEEATNRICKRMLGDADAERRERLLVFTDAATDSVDDRLPRSHDDPPATLIDHAATARSAVADQSPGAAGPSLGPDVNVQRVRNEELGELGTSISRAVDDLTPDDPDPGELRVCFDSLSPLLERYEHVVVFRFLHALTGRVRQANALAHFHLPVAADTREARLLAPLFDAVVEVRMADGRPEQRWSLHDGDVETDWLAV